MLPALVLVGVAIGDQPEHPSGVLEEATLAAAQPRAHGARFDVDVVPRDRVVGRGLYHALNVADLESTGNDSLLVERIDATQL